MTEAMPRNMDPKPRLGRGLAALLGEAKASSPNDANAQSALKDVPIEFIRSSARNPRRHFAEAELDELAASIREKGILQPIVVRPLSGAQDSYEIVAGERRWRAAQRAGKHTVPVISLTLTDREALEISIVENIQRQDLSALEEAGGYAFLASEYGYSHADIGRIVGKSRSHVANTLRLLALPEGVRDLLSDGSISAGHARALLSVARPEEMAKKIVAQGLTVRDVEKRMSAEDAEKKERGIRDTDPHLTTLAKQVSLALGANASITNSKRSKEIRIRYKELDQLEYICNKLLS